MPEITPASQRIADYFKAVQAGETPLSVDGYSGFQAGREAAATVNETLSIGRGGSFFALDNGLLKKSDVEHVPVIKAEVNSAGNLDVTVPDKLDSAGAWLGCCDATAYNKGIIKGSGSSPLLPGGYLEVHQNGQDHFYRYTQERVDSSRLRREPSRPHLEDLINQSGSKQGQETKVIIVNGVTEEGVWIADGQQEGEKVTIVKNGPLVTINGEKVKGEHGRFMVGKHAMHLAVDGDAVHLYNDAVWQAREAARAAEKAGKTQWNIIASDFIKAAGREGGVFLNTFKPRDWRDLFALTARGLSEIGGPVGATARAVLLLSNFASIGLKEHLTIKQIRARIEADLNNASLSKKEKKTLARKDYWQQTILGKLLSENDQSNLHKIEELTAISVGVIAALGGMSIGKMAASILPGSTAQEILLNRGLFSYIIPRLLSYFGIKTYEKLIWPHSGLEQKTSKEAAAREFVEMTLGAMSATVTTLVTAGFIFDVGGELLSKLPQFVATAQARATETPPPTAQPSKTAQPEITPSVIPPPTQMQTAEPTEIPPTATEVPPTTIPPTEVPALPPTPFGGWLAGQAVDHEFLGQAADAGHLLDQDNGRPINLFGQDLNLFRFDLDNQADDKFPEVIAVKDGDNWVPLMWEMPSGDYAVDVDGDGQIDGFYTQQEFEANFPGLLVEPGHGGGGEAPVVDLGPRDFDLNDDNHQDVLVRTTEAGKEEFFLDRDQDSQIDPAVDEKVEIEWMAKPDGGIGTIVQTITFSDGGFWRFNEETGSYDGITNKGKLLWIKPELGKTAAIQGAYAAEFKLLYSPDQLALQAFKFPDDVTPLPVPVVPEPEPEMAAEVDTSLPHGSSNGFLVQSNGESLILGPRGGAEGMLHLKIHDANPDLDPDGLGVVANIVKVNNHFPAVGSDGAAITAMIQTQPVIYQINQEIAILSVERWLEANQGWLHNQGFDWDKLSPRERHEIGVRFVSSYRPAEDHSAILSGKAGIDFLTRYLGGSFDDDDDMKASVLLIVQQVEQEFPNE